MAASRRSILGAALASPLVLAACGAPARLPPVPRGEAARARPLGLDGLRFFADADERSMAAAAEQAYDVELAAWRAAGNRGPLPPATFLAISGGGDNGAFSSGVLVGWTEAGNRPEFKLVTGVSTGALVAPFAFLGPAYDPQLKSVYTTIGPSDIYRERSLVTAIFDDAMSDTSPLAALIARYADERMLAEIAREHRKGRVLLIGSSDLDAQRPVIWNMTAIAASGHPGALNLFRQVLRASSAVPGVFQPVMIDVELDGKKYQEMHVDGGAFAQLFLYPASVRPEHQRIRRAYIIRNARLDPDWALTERLTLDIAGRAISTMIASSGQNDVVRVYFISRRDNVDYNLAYIDRDFTTPHATEFDHAYMNALYAYGYEKARRGYPWHKAPPVLDRSRR
jgi:predicted acylesterase/phospholipase RssA